MLKKSCLFGAALLLAAALACAATPPLRFTCGAKPVVSRHLLKTRHQTPAGAAESDMGLTIELFIQRRSGAWTLTGTRAGGRTCILLEGRTWAFTQEFPT